MNTFHNLSSYRSLLLCQNYYSTFWSTLFWWSKDQIVGGEKRHVDLNCKYHIKLRERLMYVYNKTLTRHPRSIEAVRSWDGLLLINLMRSLSKSWHVWSSTHAVKILLGLAKLAERNTTLISLLLKSVCSFNVFPNWYCTYPRVLDQTKTQIRPGSPSGPYMTWDFTGESTKLVPSLVCINEVFLTFW